MGHGHSRTAPAEAVNVPADHPLNRKPMLLLIVGLVCLGVAFVLPSSPGKFWYSYLTAFMYWLSLALGGLFFTLIHHVTRAGWSVVVRRIAETMAATLWIFAPLFLVVLAGMGTLYHHWLHPEGDVILEGKASYLNVPFFIVRAVIYLGLWVLISRAFYGRSRKQDESGDPELSRKSTWWAPLGIVAFAMTTSFAAIDWMMSLDPHWFSTIYGVYYFSGALIMIFASLALTCMALQRMGLLQGVVTAEHYHDLGKYLFGFTIFWAYIAFSQYFLIWYANIPEETLWYEHRAHGGWYVVGWILMAGHFMLPFFFLMSRHIKRHKVTFVAGCVWMVLMHWFDLFYLVQPTLTDALVAQGVAEAGTMGFGVMDYVVDLLCFVGIAGVWKFEFLRRLTGAPLVPVRDPRLGESLAFENF